MLDIPFRVVLDANVLYPFTLRDSLLRAASEGFFQIFWSGEILDEAVRHLVASGTVTAEQGARLRATMERAFSGSRGDGIRAPHFRLPSDPKDRHVAAAALTARAQVIVTVICDIFPQIFGKKGQYGVATGAIRRTERQPEPAHYEVIAEAHDRDEP